MPNQDGGDKQTNFPVGAEDTGWKYGRIKGESNRREPEKFPLRCKLLGCTKSPVIFWRNAKDAPADLFWNLVVVV
jgi:hypothetical protein